VADQIGPSVGLVVPTNTVAGDSAGTQLIAGVTEAYPVTDLSIVEPDLEGVVTRIYGERETARAQRA
jgi:hypothetical protein